MKLTREELIAAGLTEAQADAVLTAHKEVLNGDYVPKHRFDEVNIELKNSKASLIERDTQIKELQKFEGTATELSTKVTELEKLNKEKDTQYSQQVAAERKRNAVKFQLLADDGGKPHDTDMVLGLFNLENIVMDEAGKITAGYKEQSDSIRKERSFLFEAKTPPTDPVASGGGGWKPVGTPPANPASGGGNGDTATSFGQSLAAAKLGMLGKPVAGATN